MTAMATRDSTVAGPWISNGHKVVFYCCRAQAQNHMIRIAYPNILVEVSNDPSMI